MRTDEREKQKQPRSGRRWIWILAVTVVVGAAVAVLLTSIDRARSQAESLLSPEREDEPALSIGPRPGQLAPDFTLRSLRGEPVTLSGFRGQVVILDFWASWCAPCKITFPALHALWQHFIDRDVVLVGVSLDRSRADADAYLTAAGYDDMIAVWESRTASLAVADRFAVEGIPHTLVIDPDGVVRYKGHPTGLTREALEKILESPRSQASPAVH